MTLKKILLVFKKSAYETYFKKYRNAGVTGLAGRGDKGLAHLKRAHETHYRTLRWVEAVLKRKRIPFDRCVRGKVFDEKNYDLILSVGGDGTVLDAAKNIRHKVLLGLNSDTNHSVGKLCNATRDNFENRIDLIGKDQFRFRKLSRLELILNGRRLQDLILNDMLFCHACPGAMSHYFLEINRRHERQRSSGLWLSTASGSTGAMRSAGGKAMSAGSRKIQYRPRELFEGKGIGYTLLGGVLDEASAVVLRSQMQEAMVYVDGAHNRIRLNYGDELKVLNSKSPLKSMEFH